MCVTVLILECNRQTLPVACALREAGFEPFLRARRACKDDRFVGFSFGRGPSRTSDSGQGIGGKPVLGCVQFMYDADTGTSQFLEINPRTDANIAICELSGINPVALAVSDRLRSARQDKARTYSVARRLNWILGDLNGLREPGVGALQRFARLQALVHTLLKANGYAVFQRRDPVPAIYLTYLWTGATVMGALKGAFFGRRQSH